MRYAEMVLPFEEAFAGMASRPGEELHEAYWWTWLVRHRPAEEWPSFQQLPIVLIGPAPRHWYWRMVEKGRIVAWEGCHAALLGVGSLPGQPRVSIYDRAIMARCIDPVMSSRGLGHVVSPQITEKAVNIWLSRQVLTTKFGDRTPFYI